MNDARNQVGFLSIFHFIVALIIGLITSVPALTLPLGVSMLAESILQWNFAQLEVSILFLFFGLGYFLIPAVLTFIGLFFMGCLVTAGYFLWKKRNYSFCRFTAGAACLFIPLGTILGVLTFIVLSRPPVRELFHGAHPVPVTG